MPLRLEPDAFARAEREVQKRLASPTLGWDLVYLREQPKGASRTLGHAMPAGVAYGGMTGGMGIHYVFGVRAAVTGHNGLIHLHVLLADRNFDRQWAHLFYDDGAPYNHARHVAEQNGRRFLDVPYNNRGFPELQIDDPAAAAQAAHVKASGLLSGAAARLLKYMSHDTQHLSRVFDAVPAAYLACDPVSRDRLVTVGSQACWRLNLYPVRGRRNFGGWGSLFAARKRVDANPHTGIGMDRAHGWLTHVLGWAHGLSADPRIRRACVDVAREDVAVRAKAQMPAGNVSVRSPSGKAFQGRYWFTTGWEEGAILANGARSVIQILSAPQTARDAETMKQVYTRVGRWVVTGGWNDETHAPGFHIALREKGAKQFLDRPIPRGKCAFYMGTPLAWYLELTGEKRFLDRLEEMAADQPLAERALRELGNWSYCLWLVQSSSTSQSAP
jgi:hypothetical protein